MQFNKRFAIDQICQSRALFFTQIQFFSCNSEESGITDFQPVLLCSDLLQHPDRRLQHFNITVIVQSDQLNTTVCYLRTFSGKHMSDLEHL